MTNLLFKRRLNEAITIAPSTGTDGHGYHGHETAVPLKSLLIDKSRLIQTPEGKEVVSSSRVYVEKKWNDPKVTDKITLEDGSTPLIVQINKVKNHRNVINHYVAFLDPSRSA